MSRTRRKPRRHQPRRAGGDLSLLALSRVMRALQQHERSLSVALGEAAHAPGDGGRWPGDALAEARAAREEAVEACVKFGSLPDDARGDAHTVGMLEALYRLVAAALPNGRCPAGVEPLPASVWGADTLLDDCVLRVRERAIGWWLLGRAIEDPERWAKVIEACYSDVPPDPATGVPALLWQDAPKG